MGNTKRKLDEALEATNKLPDDWFGTEAVSIEDLPSVRRNRRVRKNIFVDEATAQALEVLCQRHHTSFTDMANDILTKFVTQQKKRRKQKARS